MAINPLEFNERAEFGSYQVVTNEINGNQTNTFVPAFSRWFGYLKQSLTQQYTLMGNKIVKTKLIAIRHDAAVTEQMIVKIGNEEYNILPINSDDRAARETFDLLTLQRIEKP